MDVEGIYNKQDQWKKLKLKISIGETILALAKENNGVVPMSILKTRLNGRIPWMSMNTQLDIIIKQIGGEVSHLKSKGRGRKKTVITIPKEWWSWSSVEQRRHGH